MQRFTLLPPLAILLILPACSSATPPPDDATNTDGASTHRSTGPTISADADIGGINEQDATKVFAKAKPAIEQCFASGLERIPYLAGEVKFHVRIAQSGAPSRIYIDSELGDHETEKCMIATLQRMTFPKPVGGREGTADDPFTFPLQEGRPPVDWSVDDMGKKGKDAAAALNECRAKAGGGNLTATLYVNTDGTVQSLGVGGEASPQARECVVEKITKLKFDSPGSFAAKVTLRAE
ncbi:MAG: AgmX/PglI C-terminal domain-containing protein [Polyangiaceae bacterium]